MHEIHTRQLVMADGVHHGRIRAIRDGISDARFLAFELEPETAGRTADSADQMTRLRLQVKIPSLEEYERPTKETLRQ